MHLPCKQVDVGALPTDSTILRLESERPRGFQAKDVLHRLGEGGHSTTGFPIYGWQANLLRDGVISNSSLFESEVNGANPFPAANFRSVVK